MTTIGEALTKATSMLRDVGIETAARDARLLLAKATRIGVARLTLEMQEAVDAAAGQEFLELLQRRAAREPMSHILGQRAFFNHDFHVGPAVLDPRPETECLVRAALESPFDRVLDLGTGSGAILISLLAERQDAQGVGSDVSTDALQFAALNADRIGVAGRAKFTHSDWFENVAGGFDLIVSNPPYITKDEMAELEPELSYEPRMALTDEGDGLSAYRFISAGAAARLKPQGRLMVEIGYSQGTAVAGMFCNAGFAEIRILPDLEGRDRVVAGVWCG